MNLRHLKVPWRVFRAATNRLVIRDYREYCTAPASGRALVSYLMHPLLPPRPFRDRVIFSPFGIAQQIPRALNEMGYVVDIVNYDNLHWRPRAGYDLFVGHGGINFEALADSLDPKTKRIYFASGLHWKEWNRRADERVSDLARRTGWLAPSTRRNDHDEDGAYSRANAIVYLGNRHAGETFNGFPCSRGIDNATYPAIWDGFEAKDYDRGRRHFLFYQGPGNIHKGLDRVLEAFAGSSLNLHVCQEIEPAFARAYRRLLSESANIHVYGFIRQRSPMFYQLVSRCNWALSATCAEGQPGSIIEMMAHGLIPIVPDAANIDLEQWGIRLAECSPAEIASTCEAAAQIPAAVCRGRSAAVRAESRERYSVEHFRASFQNALRAIITQC